MVDFADNYAALLSDRVERFKKVRPGQYNFRCPFCGDSAKSKTTARGYLYTNTPKPNYHCFNQGCHRTFDKFLEEIAPDLYQQYLLDKVKSGGYRGAGRRQATGTNPAGDRQSTAKLLVKKGLLRIDQLPDDHHALAYVKSRLIPEHQWPKLWYLESMAQLDPEIKHPATNRLAIPIQDRHHHLIAVTCRALDPSSPLRYLTHTVVRNVPQIFGIEDVDISQTIIAVEGPLDSLFLPNAVAATGTSMERVKHVLPMADIIFVLDNQPRHPDVVNKMRELLEQGQTVFVPPERLTGKDINQMVINREVTVEDLSWLISQHACSGLEGLARLSRWKKVDTNEQKKPRVAR